MNQKITYSTRKISELKENEYNPRKISKLELSKLKNSIKKFGIVDPIIINTHPERNNIIIGGHQRLKACKELGIKEIPVIEINLPKSKEEILNLALNRISGRWDEEKLADVIMNLYESNENLSLTGFDDHEIDKILKDVYKPIIENEIPEPPEEPKTKLGDIFLLGKHRLMCGDSTKEEDVKKLMDGKKVNIIITSPPYWVGKEYEKERTLSEVKEFIRLTSSVIPNFILNDGRIIINTGICQAGKKLLNQERTEIILLIDLWQKYFKENNWLLRSLRIWAKTGRHILLTYPSSDMAPSNWEFLATFYNPKGKWKGQNKIGKTWPIEAIWTDLQPETRIKEHNAPFPIKLPERFIRLYTQSNERIFDPFAGSGTTLIACEQLDRICYMMEIEPKYCDVIIKRWENFTGKKATKCNSG